MVKKQSLDNSVKYIESFDYLMNKKCQVAEVSQWSLQDIRIIIAQSVCYLLSKAAAKLISKQEDVTEKDVLNKIIGINLRDLAIMHAGYYTFDSFKVKVTQESDEKIKEITSNLCLLFGANFLLTHLNPAAEGGFITSTQTRTLFDLK